MSEEDLTTIEDASDLDLEEFGGGSSAGQFEDCLLYTSPSPRDLSTSRMPSSA